MDGHVIRSPFTETSVYSGSLATLIWQRFDHADRIALLDPVSKEEYTYKKLQREAECLSSYLLKLGIKQGDVVVFYSSNCLQFVVMLLSVWRIGAIVALVNPLATPDDLTKELQRTKGRVVFANGATSERAIKCCKTAKAKVISTEEHGETMWFNEMVSTPSGHTLPDISDLNISPEDTIAILFSSGTTGPQKAVQLTHSNILHELAILVHPAIQIVGETALTFQPLSHIYGIMMCVIAISQEATHVIMPKFNLQQYIAFVEEFEIHMLTLVPPVAVMLAKSGLLQNHNLTHVTHMFNAAAPLSSEVENEIRQQLGGTLHVMQGFGMTETTGGFIGIPCKEHATMFNPLKPGSVGVVYAHCFVKIIDLQNGHSLGPNQQGEICCKGPVVMKGYLGDAGATATTINNEGWIHTGDIGYYDNNGCFYVVDRLKELIKYNAIQVSPSELEAHILTHPSVADVGVVGKPDQVHGQLPMAWVVKKKGAELTEEDIICGR